MTVTRTRRVCRPQRRSLVRGGTLSDPSSPGVTERSPCHVVPPSTHEVELHEYRQHVTWTAPVEFSSAPSAEVIVRGTVFVLACREDRCLAPKTYEFQARLRVDPAPSFGRSGPGTVVGGYCYSTSPTRPD